MEIIFCSVRYNLVISLQNANHSTPIGLQLLNGLSNSLFLNWAYQCPIELTWREGEVALDFYEVSQAILYCMHVQQNVEGP